MNVKAVEQSFNAGDDIRRYICLFNELESLLNLTHY